MVPPISANKPYIPSTPPGGTVSDAGNKQEIDRVIEELALASGCRKDQLPEIKTCILNNLDGKSSYFLKHSYPANAGEYFGLKVYSAMLNTLGSAIRVPNEANRAAMMPTFRNDFKEAAARFAGGKDFTSKLQNQLFVQYVSFIKNPYDGLREAGVVYAGDESPLAVARINVDKNDNIPDKYVYKGNNGGSDYVMATADESTDPFYAAVRDKVEKGTPFSASIFKASVTCKASAKKELKDYLKETTNRCVKLSELLDDKKRDAYDKAISADRDIRAKISIAALNGPFETSAPLQSAVNELYARVAEFYDKDKLNALVKGQPSTLDETTKKLKAAETALEEYSLQAFKDKIRILSRLIECDAPPEVTIDNLKAVGEWLSKFNARLLFGLGSDALEYMTARKYFILAHTDGLSSDAAAKFERNLKLLESGKLSYEKLSTKEFGIAQPVSFASGGYRLNADLIDFDAGSNDKDPVISTLARRLRKELPKELSSFSNMEIIKEYLNLYNKANKGGQSAGLNVLNFNTEYKAAEPVIGEPAFSSLNHEIGLEKQGNHIVFQKVAEMPGAAMKPEDAEKKFKPVIEGDDLWVIVRNPGGPVSITAVSQKQKNISAGCNEERIVLEGLLKIAEPEIPEKDFDLFKVAATFRGNNMFLDNDYDALDVIKNLALEHDGGQKVAAQTLEKAAALLLKYVRDLKGKVPLITIESIRNALSSMQEKKEKDAAVVELAIELVKIVQVSNIATMEGISNNADNQKTRLISVLKNIISFSKNDKELMSFLNNDIHMGSEFLVINRNYMDVLLKYARTRTVCQDSEVPVASKTKDITVGATKTVDALVRDHPILAVKLYLYRNSNAPNPIMQKGSEYYTVDAITSNDIDAFINWAWFNALDPSKRSLNEDDFRVLSRVRDHIREGRARICNIDLVLKETDDVSRDVNRALKLLEGLRDSLKRLTDDPEPSDQRLQSQLSAGQKPNALWNLFLNSVGGLMELPSFAAQTKSQNNVVDGFILAIKQQMFGKGELASSGTRINAAFIREFCRQYGALLRNPLINDITGSHPEISAIIDPEAFLLSMAAQMETNNETWESLNFNAADFKDKRLVDAKRILQAALLLYHPGLKPTGNEIKGIVATNIKALAVYGKTLAMGRLAFNDYALLLKSYLIQNNKVNTDAAYFSLMDDKLDQNAVRAAGKSFLEFLENYFGLTKGFLTRKTSPEITEYLDKLNKDKVKSLVHDLEKGDPMNELHLKGNNATVKFTDLVRHALALRDAKLDDPISFTYGGSAEGNRDIQKGLLIFVRSILPNMTASNSIGEDSMINFGTTLFSIIKGKGKIHVLKGEENEAAADKIEKDPQPSPVTAFDNQVFCNFLNFKYLMAPSIQVQMQAGFFYQMGLIEKARLNGDPYANCDFVTTLNKWLLTRAQFVAFQVNPLAWINPLDKDSEVWQLIRNGDYVSAGLYGVFFGKMALGMSTQIAMQLRPGYNRAMSTLDRWKGRESAVTRVTVTNMLLQDAKFIESELKILEEGFPGITARYNACRAGSWVGQTPFRVIDWAFHPLDKLGQTAPMRVVANALKNNAGRFIGKMKNKVGGMLVKNPRASLDGRGFLNFVEDNRFFSIFTDPTARWNFEVTTPVKKVTFSPDEIAELAADRSKLQAILERQGYVIKNNTIAKRRKGTVITTDQLNIIEDLLGKTDLAEVQNIGPLDIQYTYRTTTASLSALDVFKLGADPGNAEHVFGALGFELSGPQKTALLNDIRGNFDKFEEALSKGISDLLPDNAVKLPKTLRILNDIITKGPGVIDKEFPDLEGEDLNILKSLANWYQTIKDPVIRGRFIDKWEKALLSRSFKIQENLIKAAKNPRAEQEITLIDHDRPAGFKELHIKVRNSDLIHSIESRCNPSVIGSLSMTPAIRTKLYLQSLENIYELNKRTLSELVEQLQIEQPEYLDGIEAEALNEGPKGAMGVLSKVIGIQTEPKAFREYFSKIQDKKIRYAKLLISKLYKEHMIGTYEELFKSNFFGRVLLNNRSQSLIAALARITNFNELMTDLAIEGAPVRNGDMPTVPEQASGLQPALAEENPISGTKQLDNKAKSRKILYPAESLGGTVKGGLIGSIIISGIFSTVDAVRNKKSFEEAAKNTAIGTGIGTNYALFQYALRRFGKVRSGGLAGGIVGAGVTGWENWHRITSLDPELTKIGLTRIGLGVTNGIADGATFTVVLGLGEILNLNPVSGTIVGVSAGVGASTVVDRSLDKAENAIMDKQWNKYSPSFNQHAADVEIKYYFKNNYVAVEFWNPARNDAVSKAFPKVPLVNEIRANLDNEESQIKQMLSLSGIKKIQAEASVDLNMQVIQALIENALQFKAAHIDEVKESGIEVIISHPVIHSYGTDGKIADYTIIMRSGKDKEYFSCGVTLEGDKVATQERLKFEKYKDKLGIIDVLMSHVYVQFDEFEKYPVLKDQIAQMLSALGYTAKGDFKQALSLFLNAKGRPEQNTLDASVARLLCEAVKQDDLFKILQEHSLMFTGADHREDIYKQLETIQKRIIYINSSKKIKAAAFRNPGEHYNEYKPGAIEAKPDIFNPDVLVIQTALNALGYLDLNDVNGYFGEATSKALKDGKFVTGSYYSRIDENVVQNINTALDYLPDKINGENWKDTKVRMEEKKAQESTKSYIEPYCPPF